MMSPVDAIDAIYQFVERGGPVLLLIGGVIFALWTLIVERLIFFGLGYPSAARRVYQRWENRSERRSWEAHQIRESMVAEVKMMLMQSLSMIKALVSICPLLGLLGTVTGMMEVFDVMAVVGTGSARNMASGISKATIPTMAGMVGALTGVFLITILERGAKRRVTHLADRLTFDH